MRGSRRTIAAMSPSAVTGDPSKSDRGPARGGELLDVLERVATGIVGVTSAVFASEPPIDLTLLQWRTLVVVIEAQDGVRISDLAGRVGSSLPSASRLVDRLVRRGLIRVETDTSDRRVRIARPTPAGTELRQRLVVRRREFLGQQVRDLDLSSEVVAGLDAIGHALERHR
jgi:DNA-binding MarR family transcriptional regulator